MLFWGIALEGVKAKVGESFERGSEFILSEGDILGVIRDHGDGLWQCDFRGKSVWVRAEGVEKLDCGQFKKVERELKEKEKILLAQEKEIEEINRKVKELEGRNSELLEGNSDLLRNNKNLEAEVTRKVGQVGVLTGQLQKAKEEEGRLKGEILRLEGEIAALSGEVGEGQAKLEAATAEKVRLSSQISELREQGAEEMRALRLALETAESYGDTIGSALGEAEQREQRLLGEMKAQSAQLEQLKDSHEVELRRYEEQLAQLSSNERALSRQKTYLKEQEQALDGQLKDLQTKMKQAEDSGREKVAGLLAGERGLIEQERDRLKVLREQLEEDSEKVATEKKALEENRKVFEKEVAETRAMLAKKEKELEGVWAEQKNALEEEKKRLQQALVAAERGKDSGLVAALKAEKEALLEKVAQFEELERRRAAMSQGDAEIDRLTKTLQKQHERTAKIEQELKEVQQREKEKQELLQKQFKILQKIQEHGVMPEKKAFEDLLADVNEFLKNKHEGEKSCFISYAWEVDHGKNEKLQGWLSQFREDLVKVGFHVFLDIYRMQLNMEKTMRENIEKSDVIFVIGTPRLKARAEEAGKNNLKFELDRIMQSQKPVVPLLVSGDFGSAFPTTYPLTKNLVYNFVKDDYHALLVGLKNPRGIVPVISDIADTERSYRALVENFFNKRAQIRGDVPELTTLAPPEPQYTGLEIRQITKIQSLYRGRLARKRNEIEQKREERKAEIQRELPGLMSQLSQAGEYQKMADFSLGLASGQFHQIMQFKRGIEEKALGGSQSKLKY